MQKTKALALLTVLLPLLVITSHGLAAGLYYQDAVNAWCLTAINSPEELTPGPHPVRVAVIDSGLRPGSAANTARGYNYVFESTATPDLLGHGTYTTGIIVGGSSDKGSLLGLGSHATIVPLVWITKYASGVLANGGVTALCSAIRDAVDVYDCQIINISSGVTTDDPTLRAAVAYAEEKGAIVVSAVGNSNRYAPDQVYYPAAYDTVVGVGSISKEILVSPFSQRNTSVYVTAPGEKVYTVPKGFARGFTLVSGTSYSTAYVSSFAALLLSEYPELSPRDFRHILQESAQDLGDAGYDTTYGHGLIDVANGLLRCLELHSATSP